MARTLYWKLIVNESQTAELFHMKDETTEQRNIIDDPGRPAVVKRLTAKLKEKWTC